MYDSSLLGVTKKLHLSPWTMFIIYNSSTSLLGPLVPEDMYGRWIKSGKEHHAIGFTFLLLSALNWFYTEHLMVLLVSRILISL